MTLAKRKIGPAPSPDEARREAFQAIADAARNARQALERAGDRELARAVEESLVGIANAAWCLDLAALTAKAGPQKWARAQTRSGVESARAYYKSRAELAREFLAEIAEGREQHEDGQRLAVRAFNWLTLRGLSAGFVPFAKDGHVCAAMVEGFAKIGQRKQPDEKAYCVEALISLGLSRAEARNRLKDKDA